MHIHNYGEFVLIIKGGTEKNKRKMREVLENF